MIGYNTGICNNIKDDKITSVKKVWSQILRYTLNILLVKFQMGKFNIRLIFVRRENMFVKKCTFVGNVHFYANPNAFSCCWLWIIENVSTQNIFDLSNQQISREITREKCFFRVMQDKTAHFLFYVFIIKQKHQPE